MSAFMFRGFVVGLTTVFLVWRVGIGLKVGIDVGLGGLWGVEVVKLSARTWLLESRFSLIFSLATTKVGKAASAIPRKK